MSNVSLRTSADVRIAQLVLIPRKTQEIRRLSLVAGVAAALVTLLIGVGLVAFVVPFEEVPRPAASSRL